MRCVDHPCTRGGTTPATHWIGHSTRSSTRAWRNQQVVVWRGVYFGNIHARVEEHWEPVSESDSRAEHPRARKGTAERANAYNQGVGTSTRAKRNLLLVTASAS